MTVVALSPARTATLHRRVRLLVAGAITYNVVEAIVAIVAGTVASSSALIGFGLDSVVEVSSAVVIVWRLSHRSNHQKSPRVDWHAVRLMVVTLFAIALYVTYDSIGTLLGHDERPERSPAGLALGALSLVVMPILAWAKRGVGASLVRLRSGPTPPRPNSALTSRPSCCSVSPRIACSAGGG